MQIIPLNTTDGLTVYVNFKHVVELVPFSSITCVTLSRPVFTATSDKSEYDCRSYDVFETPEEILALLEQAQKPKGFIRRLLARLI